jgi:hypothetical protein
MTGSIGMTRMYHYIGGIMPVAPIGIKEFAFLYVCNTNKEVQDAL